MCATIGKWSITLRRPEKALWSRFWKDIMFVTRAARLDRTRKLEIETYLHALEKYQYISWTTTRIRYGDIK
jgi:endo-alpha-1,4-polygalactosaminidase (GH114 family)